MMKRTRRLPAIASSSEAGGHLLLIGVAYKPDIIVQVLYQLIMYLMPLHYNRLKPPGHLIEPNGIHRLTQYPSSAIIIKISTTKGGDI